MSIVSKSLSLLILFSTLSLLTGCQTLTGLFPADDEQPVVEAPKPQLQTDIAKHEFDLSADQEMIGEVGAIETRENDTLSDIARHFGLGYNDITNANVGLSAWTPKAGSRVILPLQFILPDAPRKGIVLNLANMRMFYYPAKQRDKVFTYPVGIGRDGWNTPMGLTSVAVKTANPTWHVPPSIQREHEEKGQPLPSAVRAGPDNPLGLFAMRLAIPSYLIHGTNKPYGIGMQVSHGCVQMYPEDIEVMFKKTSVGTPVRIVHQPYLTAWQNGMLYLEANNPLENWSANKSKLKAQAVKELRKISKQHKVSVDWDKVDRVVERADGIPTPVLVSSPDVTEITKTAALLAHPDKFYGQPVADMLDDSDLAMLVATYNSETEAEQLAAMLNHQGPQIPARKVDGNNAYHVVAGPFKNKKEVKAVANRLHADFEIDGVKQIKVSELN